jgi:hypothetical protein
MPKYSAKEKVSEKTTEEAIQVARATQKPGQTKEQTRLISQGIQKGIEQFKKLQNEKARELDRRRRKTADKKPEAESAADTSTESVATKTNKFPWLLLLLSWIGFAVYLVTTKLL